MSETETSKSPITIPTPDALKAIQDYHHNETHPLPFHLPRLAHPKWLRFNLFNQFRHLDDIALLLQTLEEERKSMNQPDEHQQVASKCQKSILPRYRVFQQFRSKESSEKQSPHVTYPVQYELDIPPSSAKDSIITAKAYDIRSQVAIMAKLPHFPQDALPPKYSVSISTGPEGNSQFHAVDASYPITAINLLRRCLDNIQPKAYSIPGEDIFS